VTWVEVALLLSAAGALIGLRRYRTSTGRRIFLIAALFLALLLLLFGREFVQDLV
jgi:hypothetical protein